MHTGQSTTLLERLFPLLAISAVAGVISAFFLGHLGEPQLDVAVPSSGGQSLTPGLDRPGAQVAYARSRFASLDPAILAATSDMRPTQQPPSEPAMAMNAPQAPPHTAADFEVPEIEIETRLNWELSAVIRSASGVELLLLDAAAPSRRRTVRIGETYYGWRLVGLDAGHVVMRRNKETRRIRVTQGADGSQVSSLAADEIPPPPDNEGIDERDPPTTAPATSAEADVYQPGRKRRRFGRPAG